MLERIGDRTMGDWQKYVNMSGEIPEYWFAPDTSPVRSQGAVRRFDTFEEARDWAKRNPGETIARSPDGNGFFAKYRQRHSF
jgi:hypothetical protein